MGWPEATLKAAMANCNDQGGQVSACSALTSRSEQEMNDCAVPNRVAESLDGCRFMLLTYAAEELTLAIIRDYGLAWMQPYPTRSRERYSSVRLRSTNGDASNVDRQLPQERHLRMDTRRLRQRKLGRNPALRTQDIRKYDH